MTSYSLGVPTGVANNYSYENWLKLEVISKPDTYMSGLKIWGPQDGNGWGATGINIMMGVSTSGMTPVNTSGIKCSGVVGLGISGFAANYYGASNYLSLTRSGGTSFTGIGDISDFLVIQLQITSAALVNTGQHLSSLTISYDEA